MAGIQLTQPIQWLSLLFCVALLAGCSSSGSNSSRYSIKHDHGPSAPVDVSHVKDAVPKVEPKSRGGNKSRYTVLGKTYSVMASSLGYKERGGASWYGKKFHGHKTSNGEVYDMYGMTAAHKSLPLPTYVQVTNLSNGKKVIVRVNDRGPFHPGRIIDLSYAAAAKLDMLKSGTAKVEVEAIDPRTWNKTSTAVTATQSRVPVQDRSGAAQYIQVGAYSSEAVARQVAVSTVNLTGLNGVIREYYLNSKKVYRVQLGPLNSSTDSSALIRQLSQAGFGGARVVDLSSQPQ